MKLFLNNLPISSVLTSPFQGRSFSLSCLLQSLAWLKIRTWNHFLSLCHWMPPRTKHIWVVLHRLPPSWWVPQFFLPCFPCHIPFSHLIFPFMNKVSERWCGKTKHFLSLIPSIFRSETCLILSGFSLGWTRVLPIPSSHQPMAHLPSTCILREGKCASFSFV